jgi:trigger factor
MSAGEEKEFRFTFPDDYEEEELSGKEAIFKVSIEAVQSRELPELTDELAQEEGEYETAEELMETLESELLKQAERQAKSDLLDEVVDEILVDAEIVYPPVMIEAELDRVLESSKEQMTRSGWQWDDYLRLQGESEESLREQWRESATERISRGLVLQEFIKEEQLQVSAADIDASVEKRLAQFGENEELRDQLRSIFTQGQGLEMMNNEILMEKVQERVFEIVSGNAPDLETLAAEVTDEEE